MEREYLVMSSLMWASCFFLAVGSVLLTFYKLVPQSLTVATGVAVILVALTSIFVMRGRKWAVHLGALLGLLAILISSSSNAHRTALTQIGTNPTITSLDVLMIGGFYVFPAIYIIIWLGMMVRSRGKLS